VSGEKNLFGANLNEFSFINMFTKISSYIF